MVSRNKKYQYLRKFDFHERIAGNRSNDDTCKPDDNEEDSVKLWRRWDMRMIQNNEPNASQRKHEGRSKTLHDVLSIHSVGHECNLEKCK